HGTWKALTTPCPMHLIFDQSHMSAGPIYDSHPSHGWTQIVVQYDWSEDNNAELEKGWITKGDTIPDLAIKIGLDPSALDATVARWNADAASGEDTEFGRTLMLKPLSTKGPYYAVELSPSMLNTQGGPRRNEKAEIVKPDGTPIPRLYSAGELGSIYSYLYQGTGNIGECLAFGRIAGREAATLSDWA
ncbi:MAG: FAD-binding protein, partial [Pseudomonadota bacterium]|nr:FAD-binding protein [Pseudomonadota bacterium]